ncbi:GNAT family N-acetyltransferase [Tissierella praeacuta]|uniref:lipid II:glycine glycyltransferase FemX n=1 Tax=Tissierella praeacuta TaxID=43131 RepID=UPI00333F14BB
MYRILNTDSCEWNQYLSKMPLNLEDIYFTSEYYELDEINGDGIAKLFVYYEDNKIAMYPFILNRVTNYDLPRDYYDIETAYGYGGPITNCQDEYFLNNFEESFVEFCKENYIVAEFIRFHPLIKNERIFKRKIQVIHNRNTVFLDLTKGINKIWKEDINSKNRNVIKKAMKNGLHVEINNDYKMFKLIYKQTMDKVDANDYYYFDDKYYESIKENNNCMLLSVKRENKVIAIAIFMGYGDYFHYHLAGSLKDELKFSPNNLLIWEAIKYAVDNEYKIMHFGGGLTDSLDDNLFKFKSRFSKQYADFYIGKRIHDKEIYSYLINEWENRNNKKATMLLQYRY